MLQSYWRLGAARVFVQNYITQTVHQRLLYTLQMILSMESAVEPEDPVYGDAAHCRRAYHRPVASPVKEAAENAVGTSQILRTANVAETSGAASVLKEAAENTVRASQIERTANLAETPGPAPVGKVTAMILVEASHEP